MPDRAYWPLEQNVPSDVLALASSLKAVAFDVDGVLTDGGLYFGAAGDEYKRFHTQDGLGLKLLRAAGVHVALITARSSAALDARVKELGITHFYQGREEKLAAFEELISAINVQPGECCYVGDDLVDLPIMTRCGLAIAVANANHVAKRVALWVTQANGGAGAVREVCELILFAQKKFDDAVNNYLR